MRDFNLNRKRILNEFYKSEKGKYSNKKSMKKLKFKSAFKIFKLDNIADVKRLHPEYGFKERMAAIKELW